MCGAGARKKKYNEAYTPRPDLLDLSLDESISSIIFCVKSIAC